MRYRKTLRQWRSRRAQFESLEARTLLAATAIGDEIRINDLSLGPQQVGADARALADLPDGGYVAVYAGRGAVDRDGIYLRRFDAEDQLIAGSTMLVNSSIAGLQYDPAVAALPDGSFVVAWAGAGVGDRHGIFAQWFDAEGNALGDEVLVNSTLGGKQWNPQAAVLTENSIAIAWEGVGSGDFDGVFLRTASANGQFLLQDEFRINVTTDERQSEVTLDGHTNGRFVVAWNSLQDEGQNWNVYARELDASLLGSTNPGTNEFLVNETTAGAQLKPSLAVVNRIGDYVIAYSSRAEGADTSNVLTQRFSFENETIGDEVQINEAGDALRRDVSLDDTRVGGFVVTWTSGVEDGSGWEIVGRQFDSDSEPLGEEFVANQENSGVNSGHQFNSTTLITMESLTEGDLVVAWNGLGSTDRRGVFAQRFEITPNSEATDQAFAEMGT